MYIQKIKNDIARDLHDHIGSTLTSASLLLQVANTSVENNPYYAKDILGRINESLKIVQENLHDIVWGIQSHQSSMDDFVFRMRQFLFVVYENSDASVNFYADESVDKIVLRVDRCFDFYLIFKEVVTNGAKYASAKKVTVNLKASGSFIELNYEDDGVGFDTTIDHGGNGLTNIKKRASNLNGFLQVTSGIGMGTRVQLKFPIKNLKLYNLGNN